MRRNWKKGSSKRRREVSPQCDVELTRETNAKSKSFEEIISKKRQEYVLKQKAEKDRLQASLADAHERLKGFLGNEGRHVIRQKRMIEDEICSLHKKLVRLKDGTAAKEFEKKVSLFERERRRIEEKCPRRSTVVARNKKKKKKNSAHGDKKATSTKRRKSAGHNRNIKINTSENDSDEAGLDVLMQEMRDAFGDGVEESERAVFVALRTVCPRCNLLMEKLTNESVMACPQCGVMTTFVDGTAAATSHTDERSFSSFAYSRAGHFQSWLKTIQAKESATIPQEILHGVCVEMAKKRVKEDDVTPQRVREALKEMRMRKYYENSVLICSLLTGKKPMRFSPEVEKTLEDLFLKIQQPFQRAVECVQPGRKNFLSYPFVAWKLLQLLDSESVDKRWLTRFPKLKGRDKLAKSDLIWKHICMQLNWAFYPSA